jgi:N-acetylmuramoyl-L-alanine amidase
MLACATLLLGGCATGLRIDTSHLAQAQASRVQHIVLHYTVGRFDSALKTLTQGPVSSHYLVAQQPPTVYRLVDENRRAFHAGVSSWRGQTGINGSSIGIEIVNAGLLDSAPRVDEPARWQPGRWEPFPPEQVAVVVALVRDIARRHDVKPHMIVGHSDVAPSRKMDPGPLFPWRQLHEAGLVPWPDAQQVAATEAAWASQPLPDAAWFQARLAQLGFALPISGSWDVATRDVLIAFQTRYRPRLFSGRPDVETAALLQVATTPGGLLMVQADGQRVAYRP